MNKVLIVGATSPVGRYMAHEFAMRGFTLMLAGRDKDEVSRVAQDIRVRFRAQVFEGIVRMEGFEEHEKFVQDVVSAMGGIDGVVIVAGSMEGAEEAKTDPVALRKVIDINFSGPASLITLCANRLVAQGKGFIAAVTSVAGDRGRATNYPYGSAKGGLSLFLQGLRNLLAPKGIQVTTIKPGFIDTRMTFGMKKLLFLASPKKIAKQAVSAILARKDVVYCPKIWWLVMTIIKLIPERIFKFLRI